MTAPAPLPSLFDPAVLEDPFDWYQQALGASPVMPIEEGRTYVILSHKLVSEAAGDPETFSSDFLALMNGARAQDPEIKAITAEGWPDIATLLTADPPVHTRFRKLVNLAFSAPRVNALEGHIRSIVVELLDRLADHEAVDFVRDFAVPLPVEVIAEPLGMGRGDIPDIKRWSNAFADRLGGLSSREREIECAREIVEWQHVAMEKVRARRAAPSGDLLSAIVNARVEGERPLDDPETLSIFQQLMVAGNETTTSTLAGGLLLLIRNPDQLAHVRADPALIPNMVEEMLRLLSPTAGLWRVTTREVEMGGVRIPQGAMVMLRFAAANRDPAVFPDPDRFDVTRRNTRTHLAFGRGIHMCVGNMLSRKELTMAFEEIVKRFDRFSLVDGANDFRHAPNKLLRGLIALHVKPERAAA